MKKDEPAYYMKPDTDCMGNPTNGYWRQELFCMDGECVIGNGMTKEEAEKDASKERDKHNKFLAQPLEEQLKALTNEDHICEVDMIKAIKILTVLVFNLKSVSDNAHKRLK